MQAQLPRLRLLAEGNTYLITKSHVCRIPQHLHWWQMEWATLLASTLLLCVNLSIVTPWLCGVAELPVFCRPNHFRCLEQEQMLRRPWQSCRHCVLKCSNPAPPSICRCCFGKRLGSLVTAANMTLTSSWTALPTSTLFGGTPPVLISKLFQTKVPQVIPHQMGQLQPRL